MDMPDWVKLVELVEELGCGEVRFFLNNSGSDGDDLELRIDRIALEEVSDDGEQICVQLEAN